MFARNLLLLLQIIFVLSNAAQCILCLKMLETNKPSTQIQNLGHHSVWHLMGYRLSFVLCLYIKYIEYVGVYSDACNFSDSKNCCLELK